MHLFVVEVHTHHHYGPAHAKHAGQHALGLARQVLLYFLLLLDECPVTPHVPLLVLGEQAAVGIDDTDVLLVQAFKTA